jgi:hypothetical protein
LTHLRHLDDLLTNARQVNTALRDGDAEALNALTDAREASLEALLAMGDIDPQHPQAERCRQRLEELAQLNAEVTVAIEALRVETTRRLKNIVKSRKGLDGYRDAAVGGRGPGARHGRG